MLTKIVGRKFYSYTYKCFDFVLSIPEVRNIPMEVTILQTIVQDPEKARLHRGRNTRNVNSATVRLHQPDYKKKSYARSP
ncbi:hypothetical protein Mboo_1687 [Methanoregula boonei 6A8]|jgi:hypothetical protein|uniref:Uncharacterized protein n=1 Tax=Methanoregula boonei (strain DSM 21154 / JCM 14090 / 6A8) TaxID=456442 RepID=A7I8Z3_METB6|nr:hypothetical protein Mboo_1687 [Methanoregula boonei 6A8]